MKVKLLLMSLLACCSLAASAQDGAVSGRVITREGRNVIDGAKVTLRSSAGATRSIESNMDGTFTFPKVQEGEYRLIFEARDFGSLEVPVTVGTQAVNLGNVSLLSEYSNYNNIDIDDFGEFENANDGSDAMPVLSASKDVFDNIAGFKFSSIRYRTRGYDQSTQNVYVNGILFNDALTGYSPWSLWSGLNDATRNQEVTSGSFLSDYGLGGINGTTNINVNASSIRKGWRFSAVNASGQYRLRLMATYGSGELDNGWSYAFSVSTRQGGNDWVNGVFYNNYGYFAAVEKKLDAFNRIGFTFMGTPGERAVQAASTQEVYDLVGSNYYNANWGYQGGRSKSDMRNARMRRTHEPIAMLNYSYEPSSRFKLDAAVSFRFGFNGYSALDWTDGRDPRPDYYRNLPSYFEDRGDIMGAAYAREGWMTDWNIRQINWERMYNENRNNYFDDEDLQKQYYKGVDPTGKTIANTVLEERRTDQRDFNAKVQIMSIVGQNGGKLNAGLEFRRNRTEYYKKMKDLLGGDYYLDIDKFVKRDLGEALAQNNVHTPNRLVKKGDKYGYDYYAHLMSDKLWATYRFRVEDFEIGVGAEMGHTAFWREGKYRKALFLNDSEGKSEEQNFWTYNLKTNIGYRINNANTIWLNASMRTDAPYFQNSFLAPRSRNTAADNLKTEKTQSIDLNYMMNTPYLRLRATAFYTHIKDKTDLISFYNDHVDARAYTNMSITGIDQKHMGFELGFSAPTGLQGLTVEGAFAYGHYYYSSNPYMTMTQDNNNLYLLQGERIHWKDMKVEGTPQTALNLGLRYRGPGNIYAGVDFNYFNAMYLSMNPLYRVDLYHQGLSYDASQALARQEKFDNSFVINANIGKSWYLPGNYNLGFSLDVRNVLNDKDIKTGGYEQMRLARTGTGAEAMYDRFSSKYFYMFGTTYYLNVYLRF